MIGLIGGTGTVGRHLARILIDRGESFRLLTRDVAKARAALGIGDDATPCEPVHADLAQPATLVRALTGIDRLFLSTNVHLEQVALQGRPPGFETKGPFG